MFASGDTETVEWLRPPEKDRWGDPIPGTDTAVPIEGCLFAPGPSAENMQGANQTDTAGTVFAPPGSAAVDVADSDKLRVRGDIYEVDGKPRLWGHAGVEIVLRMVTG